MNIRQHIISILSPVIGQKSSLSHLSAELQNISDVKLRAYIQEVCFGLSRWYFQLDFLANQLLQKPLKEKDHDIFILILIGLYELLYLRTAQHAAVSEAVTTAKEMKKPWAAGLINAVLRRFLREKESLLKKAENDLVAFYAHPQWLIERLSLAWPDTWCDILNANNERAPMTLRVNQQKVSRDRYWQELNDVGIEAMLAQFSSQALILKKPCAVSALPMFSQGVVSVQDESAQLAVSLLDLKEGQTVLDACAAPGGKTCHILETAPNLKKMLAVDKDKNRLHRIQENLDRLGLSAELLCADLLDHHLNEQFDRILLDAPCSATGVIRRHPDIKLSRRDSDIVSFTETQFMLLKKLWTVLKPGGRLVYATCSILPEENRQTIESFLQSNIDAREIPIHATWGQPMLRGRQILPGKDQMDGFFYAILEKNKSK